MADKDDKAAKCVSLLLRALALVDADGAILRAGAPPYLTGPGGRRRLARHNLSVSALRRLLRQLLPDEERDALARIGATRYELPRANQRDERFLIEATLTPHGPVVKVHRPHRGDDYVSLDSFAPRSALRPAA
ncbi:MAG TPA: hypothetical protein VFA59_21985 [Vicinamibacterales bacterium]|nr:hypothetical protein [Vicinamibacterales bacterium]